MAKQIKKIIYNVDEIHPTAKEIADAWIENYRPYQSVMPEIAQKIKLASDIMNFADAMSFELLKEKNKRICYLIKKMKKQHGGKRPGSGRPKLKKSQKKEPTVVMRIPKSKVALVLKAIGKA